MKNEIEYLKKLIESLKIRKKVQKIEQKSLKNVENQVKISLKLVTDVKNS